jgi:hypothetical protein
MLIGAQEIMYDPIKAMERGKQLIQNLQTEIISDANHLLNSDQTEIVDSYVLKFLFYRKLNAEDYPGKAILLTLLTE